MLRLLPKRAGRLEDACYFLAEQDLEAEGFTVTDWVVLEEADNAAGACISGERVLTAARQLDLTNADVVIISACVQMPSLELIAIAEQEFGLPVLSTATVSVLLRQLGLLMVLPEAGQLLSGEKEKGKL